MQGSRAPGGTGHTKRKRDAARVNILATELTAAFEYALSCAQDAEQRRHIIAVGQSALEALNEFSQAEKAHEAVTAVDWINGCISLLRGDEEVGFRRLEAVTENLERRVHRLHHEAAMLQTALRAKAFCRQVQPRTRARARAHRSHRTRRASGIRAGTDPGDPSPGEPPPAPSRHRGVVA